MLYFTYPLDGLLMIVMPIGLAIFLHRRLGVRGSLFGWGALTFIASQVVHIPVLYGLTAAFQQHLLPEPPREYALVFNAIVLGLLAGLFEEVARYLVYRYFLKSVRTWDEALMLGAGHGGIEAIILGVLVLVTFASMYSVQSNPALIPEAQRALAEQQLAAYWGAHPLAPLVGALERVFALCTHLALSVLVLQAFTRRNLAYLFAAILWHAAVDALAVYAVSTWGPAVTEAIVGVFALAAVALIFALRPRAPAVAPPLPAR